MIERQVGTHDGGQRLDRWLRKEFPAVGLPFIFRVLRKKKVRVNRKVAKAALQVQQGDLIQIYENFPDADQPSPQQNPWAASSEKPPSTYDPLCAEKVERWIVDRQNHFMVLHKPSGIASQPGTGVAPGQSLIEHVWSWARIQKLDFKPALVHRLDQETSGLILVALSGEGVRKLTALIREHRIEKEYIALIQGHLEQAEGVVTLALQRKNSARGSKMDVVGHDLEHSQKAVTHYRLQQKVGPYSLVRILLETGRMHQIRSHFAHIGHPLLGDRRYGNFEVNKQVRQQSGLRRLFLHAYRLEFRWDDRSFVFEIPLPNELKTTVQMLEQFPDV